MKQKFLWLGMLAILLASAMTAVGCDNDPTDNNKPQTATYTGTSGGTTYTLIITDNTTYVLTLTGTGVTKTSSGTVTVNGSTFTLTPSNAAAAPFTVTVSGNGITAMNGTITFNDDTTAEAPEEVTPTPPTPPNPGTGWTVVTDSTLGYPHAIAYGGGKFVAGGGNSGNKHIIYSTDGAIWTDATDNIFNTDESINAITYGDNKFVAVGTTGKIAYSPDGITWTAVEDNALWNYQLGQTTYKVDIKSIAYGNNTFVAGGLGKMAYSSDGITWTAVAGKIFDNGTVDAFSAIAYGNNKFIVGDSSGDIAYSANGISWTVVADSTFDDEITAIAYGNNKFVAGNYNGKMAYSSDGISWTAITDSTFGTNEILTITYGNNKFVAGGLNGKMATSTDGITWTAVMDHPFSLYSAITAIAYGNNRFVASNSIGNPKIAYTTDIMGIPTTPPEPPKPGTGGTFTLTGIPSQYNGKYAHLNGSIVGDDDHMLYGVQSINMSTQTITLSPISNGSVNINMWIVDESENPVRYSGNGTGNVVVIISNTQTYSGAGEGLEEIAAIYFYNFTFANGSAVRTWNQGQTE